MAFWKELGVAALEKGKSFFRGGKQALHATKETETIVKGAKVSPLGAEKGKAALSPISKERSLPKFNFIPSFNGRLNFSMKDTWNNLWKRTPKEVPMTVQKATPTLSFTDRMKNWFHRFSPKPSATEQISQVMPSMKPARNPIFKDSGYLSWENSLPKASFKPNFNPIAKAKEAIRGKKDVAEETIKAEKKVAEEMKSSTKQATKEAPKTTEKAAEKVKNAKEAEKETAKEAAKKESTLKKTARFYAKNPKTLGWHSAFALGAYGIASGDGFLKPLLYVLGGSNASENGLGGMVGQAVAGNNAPDIYNKVTDAAGAVVDEGVNLYQTGKGTVAGVADEGANLYQIGKDYVGNGMVENDQGGYSDPSTQSYPNPYQNPYQVSNPYQNTPQGYGQDGMLNTVMSGMNHAVNEITGGSVSKMNILSLAVASYMMFGRFGWLGKAASLLLGGMTLKNINHRQAGYQQMPIQQPPSQGYQQASPPNGYLQSAVSIPSSSVSQDAEEDIVQRPRGMGL